MSDDDWPQECTCKSEPINPSGRWINYSCPIHGGRQETDCPCECGDKK